MFLIRLMIEHVWGRVMLALILLYILAPVAMAQCQNGQCYPSTSYRIVQPFVPQYSVRPQTAPGPVDRDHWCYNCGAYVNEVSAVSGNLHQHTCHQCGTSWWHENPGARKSTFVSVEFLPMANVGLPVAAVVNSQRYVSSTPLRAVAVAPMRVGIRILTIPRRIVQRIRDRLNR
jgi:hypothetical protein